MGLHIICEVSARETVGKDRTKSLGRAAVNAVFRVIQPRAGQGVRQQSYAQASVLGAAAAVQKVEWLDLFH